MRELCEQFHDKATGDDYGVDEEEDVGMYDEGMLEFIFYFNRRRYCALTTRTRCANSVNSSTMRPPGMTMQRMRKRMLACMMKVCLNSFLFISEDDTAHSHLVPNARTGADEEEDVGMFDEGMLEFIFIKIEDDTMH